MSKYYRALQARKPVTAIPPGADRYTIETQISAISAELRGPLSNAERIMLVHDRADLRDILGLILTVGSAQQKPQDA